MHSKGFASGRPEKKPSLGYFWLRLLLGTGSLLGLLLLVQSVATYYHVTRILVTADLRKWAQHEVSFIERESRRLGIQDPAQMGPLLDEICEDSRDKIASIRVIDRTGHVLVNSGEAAEELPAPQSLPQGGENSTTVSRIRGTQAGKVLVTALPLRIQRRLPGGRAELDPVAGAAQVSGPHSPQQFIEVALYMDSAANTFGRLGTNLIVAASAALGLIASMVLLWLRLPHYIRGKQLEQQTDLAREVQMDLLPATDATFKNLDFAAVCVPALQVGGDFYDIFAAEHGQIAIVLGDVSGKGLPASMVVGLLLGAVRASAWMDGSAEHEVSSSRLSELLRARTSLERFATLFWCYYEPESQILRYVNAGHLPPMLVKRNEMGELNLLRLTEGGPVLGLLQAAGYRQGRAVICPGDLLILYSDGIVEAANASGEQFNERRLLSVIQQNSDRSSTEVRDEILDRLRSFLDGEQVQDDLTLLVVRFGYAPSA